MVAYQNDCSAHIVLELARNGQNSVLLFFEGNNHAATSNHFTKDFNLQCTVHLHNSSPSLNLSRVSS